MYKYGEGDHDYGDDFETEHPTKDLNSNTNYHSQNKTVSSLPK